MPRPFECPRCRNWYVEVQMDDTCFSCEMGAHTPNGKGEVDCHFGHMSATPSERDVAVVLKAVEQAHEESQAAAHTIGKSSDVASATEALTSAEMAFARAETAQGRLPELIRWAGVIEMPGMKGEPWSRRFRDIDGVRELVEMNRRPPEDLRTAERSRATCTEMHDQVPQLMAEARVALAQARQAVTQWQPSAPVVDMDAAEAKKQAARERMARARAAKVKKHVAV